ncbi:N-acetyltransferase [Ciceribacter sp. L1K23]|uniref:GNAT family N-acetyltransferase n=1 Tax=Ciceribacter sp. L1K23 TaxID=2820276 RepID=UPI001B8218C6|nr:GNAT family N-acetyltransferase [Ciceribacter sp. L1K23]MBR0556479.1 N-acetyltransferase [Ciceribacter sp. L1K23]
MPSPLTIRQASEADLPVIRDIYNDAVANTTAIWNEVLVDLDNRRDWWRLRTERGFPVLVAERDGQTVGYATYGDWRAFDGYRHTVEHSVYVDRTCRGGGIGKSLLAALVEHARGNDKHVMIAAIEAGNAASIALHEKLGFTLVGIHREVGTKFGRWLDLAMMELRL